MRALIGALAAHSYRTAHAGNVRQFGARRLGREPTARASIPCGKVALEAADVDRGGIDKLLVTQQPSTPDASSAK